MNSFKGLHYRVQGKPAEHSDRGPPTLRQPPRMNSFKGLHYHVQGKPAEHSDRGPSEDDGRPQVPRQLWPTVHLRISASPITGTDPSQSSSRLFYAASTRHSISSQVLQSRQQFGYHHSGAPSSLNTATTGRSPHSPSQSR